MPADSFNTKKQEILHNPYECPRSGLKPHLPKIDTVSWVVGGMFGILFGLILPFSLMEMLINVVSWLSETLY